jgi:hypothetical protein
LTTYDRGKNPAPADPRKIPTGRADAFSFHPLHYLNYSQEKYLYALRYLLQFVGIILVPVGITILPFTKACIIPC